MWWADKHFDGKVPTGWERKNGDLSPGLPDFVSTHGSDRTDILVSHVDTMSTRPWEEVGKVSIHNSEYDRYTGVVEFVKWLPRKSAHFVLKTRQDQLVLVRNYNCSHGKGDVFVYQKSQEGDQKGDLSSLEALSPSILAMLGLENNAFIMAFTVHIASYGTQLPTKCDGCEFVIDHYLDLRKMYGLNLCPKCFLGALEYEESKHGPIRNKIDRLYFERVLELLPHEPIAKDLFT